MKKFPAPISMAAAALACCATLVFTGCSGKATTSASADTAPPDVEVVNVVQRTVPIYGDWVATLQGNVNANIQPQVTRYLIKQDYKEGSFVHKDDVLFEIDPRPLQATLDQAQAQLAQAKGQAAQAQAQLGLAEINVRRDTPLAAAQAIAQSQLDAETQGRAQAEASVKAADATIQAAEAAVEQAQLNLGFTKVRSLIDGIAGIAAIQIGNLVYPTSVLTTVSQVDPIKVYFPISEQEYLGIESRMGAGGGPNELLPACCGQTTKRELGVALQMTLSDNNVYPHAGRVDFADRQVDPQTGTIRIVGTFPNPGNLLTAAEAVPDAERRIAEQEDLISTLTGENPGDIPRGLGLTEQPLPESVPAGLPSRLLERRPDILEAEQRLVEANAQIGVARAALFPSLPLTEAGGLEAANFARLVSGNPSAWNLSAPITQPIFTAGRLRSNVKLTEAQRQEAVLDYQQTIQQAFRQVSDGLIDYQKDREFREHQDLLASAAQGAANLSEIRYRGGAASYLEVLTNESNYFAAEINLARAQLNERVSLVELYVALGGGWEQ